MNMCCITYFVCHVEKYREQLFSIFFIFIQGPDHPSYLVSEKRCYVICVMFAERKSAPRMSYTLNTTVHPLDEAAAEVNFKVTNFEEAVLLTSNGAYLRSKAFCIGGGRFCLRVKKGNQGWLQLICRT